MSEGAGRDEEPYIQRLEDRHHIVAWLKSGASETGYRQLWFMKTPEGNALH